MQPVRDAVRGEPEGMEGASPPVFPDAPMDFARAQEEFGGDAPLVREVLGLFLDNANQQAVQMRAAVQTQAADEVARIAHSIKGGAGNLTAMALSNEAAAVEQIAQTGKLQGVEEFLSRLENELQALNDFAKALGEKGQVPASLEAPPEDE